MARRRIIRSFVVCASMAFFTIQMLSQTRGSDQTGEPPARADPGGLRFDAKVADRFNVRWNSIVYKQTLYNPAVPPEDRGSTVPESLSLSCAIEILDPQLVLGITTECAIEKITSQGQEVDVGPVQSLSKCFYHDPLLRRIRRARPQAMGFPAGRSGESGRGSFRTQLDAGLGKKIQGQIDSLEGYFYAIVAESIEQIDVPFEPSEEWVKVTDDLEIRVAEARNTGSMYHFKIERYPKTASSSVVRRVGDFLPGKLVVSRQFIGPSGASGSGGFGGSSAGSYEAGSGTGSVEKIRYVIAVNPAEYRIPFTVEHIPLTVTSAQAQSRTNGSSRTVPLPAVEHLQNAARKERAGGLRAEPGSPAYGYNKKVSRCFKVRWNSLSYSKTLYNPAVSERGKDQRVSGSLSLLCEAEILDLERILGTCGESVITQITDGGGRNIHSAWIQPHSLRMYYQTPEYRPKHVQPSRLMRLEAKVRSALRLPLKARHRPRLSRELQPVRMKIKLDPGLLGDDRREIGRIEGYFHALTAKSYKHIEVPFKPDDEWVPLTSDVEIQVAKAWHDGSAYRYEIKERSKAQSRFSHLYPEDPLPDAIVTERRFTGPDVPAERGPFMRGSRRLPDRAGGNGSFSYRTSGAQCQIDKIEYRIAVGPSHYKIPFALENIPLPNP